MNYFEATYAWLRSRISYDDYASALRPIKVRFKRLDPRAVVPSKAHPTDAGYDLTAISREYDDYDNIVYHTGLALEIPEGYAGFIFPRSSVSRTEHMLANCVGVIDSGYRGEVLLKFRRTPYYGTQFYDEGERVGQLLVAPVIQTIFVEADSLEGSERGEGGFGSSGR